MIDLPSALAFVETMESSAKRYRTRCGQGEMLWRSWGEGPPLLLLHGGHGAWTHWIRNLAHFAARRTCWVPDLPGFGDSALPEDPDDGDSFAMALASGLREILPESASVDVVGFSFGGVIAAHLAAVARELVRRLVLVDSGGLCTPPGAFRTTPIRSVTDPEALLAAHRFNLSQIMFHHPDRIDALALTVQARSVALARARPDHLVMPDRLALALKRSDVPADAIWAEFDRPHPNPVLQRDALCALRPAAEFLVVPDAGHWCMFERPEGFNDALGQLLGRSAG